VAPVDAAAVETMYALLGEEVDEVLGVLSREKALEALVEGRGETLVSALGEAAQFVPEMIRSDRLLTTFRRGDQSSVRVVVDEFGGFVGLVSADAILGVLAGWRRQNPGSHLPV
jgi:Mg2+/Co2+ transporter CorC